MSSRGVSLGYVFTDEGTHVATIVQEVLLRKMRRLTSSRRP
jgi:acyl-CoA thioesterase